MALHGVLIPGRRLPHLDHRAFVGVPQERLLPLATGFRPEPEVLEQDRLVPFPGYSLPRRYVIIFLSSTETVSAGANEPWLPSYRLCYPNL